jgi:serine/threonine protein kinase
VWKPVHATLRGTALVLAPAPSAPASAVFEVRDAREAAGRRAAVTVGGVDAEEAVLEFASDARRDVWLDALRRVASAAMPALSDFDVVRAIGRGGGGEIFAVRRRAPGPQPLLAMKVVQKFKAFHSDSSLQHSLDERLCLQLAGGHPFVLGLRHAFQTERAMYLITDFASGGDLRAALNRRPGSRIPEDEARPLFAQLVLAVERLHSLNIMHRDVKPENVLLDAAGNVKLCDMGLAKFMPTGRYGRTKSFCGTISNMAPETALRRKPYSIAVDLWGLGVLFYRVLVGRNPFGDKANMSPLSRAADDAETLRRIIQDDVTLPSEASGLLSPAARELLGGLLEKDESKRLNLEECKESAFFAGVDFDEVLEDGRRQDAAAAAAAAAGAGAGASSSAASSDADELANFELDRLANVEINPDEIRDHGSSRGTHSRSSGGSAAPTLASSARTLLKRVANTGRMRKRPSETSIIGFAFTSGYDSDSQRPATSRTNQTRSAAVQP